MLGGVNFLQLFSFQFQPVPDNRQGNPAKQRDDLLLKVHHRYQPIIGVAQIEARKSVADHLRFLLVLSGHDHNDRDVPIGCGKLMLINIGERQRVNVPDSQLNRLPRRDGCYQEKISKRAGQSAQRGWPTMKRWKRVDVHEKGRNPMVIDGRLMKTFAIAIGLGLALGCGACDRMITPRNAQVIKDAESKSADGNYLRAITLYESALDGSAKSADIHYRLALLYDDKLHDPLNALHHFKRYLTLAPAGPH